MATASGESFDTALVRVPFESLRRTTRERKYAVDELSAITAEVSKAASSSASATASDAAATPLHPAAARELLSSMTARLRRLKRSLEEASRLEELDAARIRARIEHVAYGGNGGSGSGGGSGGNGACGSGGGSVAVPERGSLVPWTRARFDRMVADDLARRGRARTARALRDAVAAEEGGEGGGEAGRGRGGLDLLVDWDVYAEAEPALAALASPVSPSSSGAGRNDFDRAEPALEWCRKHAARLKKLRSPLPFRLRLQQFVELALGGGGDGGVDEKVLPPSSSPLPPPPLPSASASSAAALAHAKKHLAPQALGDSERLAELQRAVLLLVVSGPRGGGGGGGRGREGREEGVLAGFPPAARRRYADLLSGESAWRSLASLLRSEVARVHGMAARSQLALQVTAGLAALKPPPGAVFDPLSAPSLPPSAASSSSRDDPLSSRPLATLAQALPHARRLHSQLVCGLTGKKMDDANPPAALPCGATFSESGLRALAGDDGCVECPLHGGESEGRTPLAQLRRVFVS